MAHLLMYLAVLQIAAYISLIFVASDGHII